MQRNLKYPHFAACEKVLTWIRLHLAGAYTFQESCQSFGKKQKSSIRWASLLLQNICNRSNSFSLTQVSLSGREKPKHNTVQCRFHAVKEKFSPRVPHANKTCPECELIAMQTRFPALRHHLRPYFQLQCHEHLALTGLLERRRGGSRQA